MSQKKGRPTISLDVSAAVRQHRPVVLVEANNNNTNTNSANGNHHAQHCVAPCSCSSHPAGWSSGLSVSGTAMPIHPQQPQHTLDFNATRVLDHLYLGSFSDAMQRADMVELGIRYILNVARECDTDTDDSEDGMTPGGPSFRYLKLALKDHSDEDIGQHFHAAIEFIEEARRSGGKVLVHCRQGVSRSPTIVLAYIMRAYSMSLSEALQLVQAKRDSVCPNIGFILALEEYAMRELNMPPSPTPGCGGMCYPPASVSPDSPMTLHSAPPVMMSSREVSAAFEDDVDDSAEHCNKVNNKSHLLLHAHHHHHHPTAASVCRVSPTTELSAHSMTSTLGGRDNDTYVDDAYYDVVCEDACFGSHSKQPTGPTVVGGASCSACHSPPPTAPVGGGAGGVYDPFALEQ
eukprot:PhM_4_TR9446/c0_g1_i4/m.9298